MASWHPRLGTDPYGRHFLALGRTLRPLDPKESRGGAADWMEARRDEIRRALDRALARPSGGWMVVDASSRIDGRPRRYRIDGHEIVAYRAGGALHIVPGACPHMGAPLELATVRGGRLVCRWHGMTLGGDGHGRWRPLEAHDDGVLAWVRPEPGDAAIALPIRAPRPERFIAGVIRTELRCDPADVIANRLDPWHGVWLHPYAFARLRVLDRTDDLLTVRVAYRALGPLCVEVDCTFHCPDPRTVVMTIVDGEGAGSVVETHATPVAPGRTAVVEATLATSGRRGFRHAHLAAPLIRPLLERAARRLWVDDGAYAERTCELRGGIPAPAPLPRRSLST